MREGLINAAVSVFSKKGFYKASMDDIAAEAEVAKGTLYYYFKNKSELFKTVVVEGINYLTDELIKIVNNSNDSSFMTSLSYVINYIITAKL